VPLPETPQGLGRAPPVSGIHSGRPPKALMIHTPRLSKKSAADLAIVIVLNVKTVATHQAFFDHSAPGAPDEFRDMTRLYLQRRLGFPISGKKRIPS
jgi:hypothetical protein